MPSKKVVIISDTHCGAPCGLTPPDWQWPFLKSAKDEYIVRRNKYARIQSEMWNWYTKTLKDLGEIDVLIHLGDAIDGNNSKMGGVENLVVDRNQQCDMASTCIKVAKADKKFMIYGTGYHTGNNEDYEELIAKEVNADIGSHSWIKINGKIFDCKHKLGNSSMPYTRGTAISKEKMWNSIWAERELQPKSDILLRGHVHYDYFTGSSDFLAVVCPGLEWTNRYGARNCTSLVTVGLVVFDVEEDGNYSWEYKIAKLPTQKAKVVEG